MKEKHAKAIPGRMFAKIENNLMLTKYHYDEQVQEKSNSIEITWNHQKIAR